MIFLELRKQVVELVLKQNSARIVFLVVIIIIIMYSINSPKNHETLSSRLLLHPNYVS